MHIPGIQCDEGTRDTINDDNYYVYKGPTYISGSGRGILDLFVVGVGVECEVGGEVISCSGNCVK